MSEYVNSENGVEGAGEVEKLDIANYDPTVSLEAQNRRRTHSRRVELRNEMENALEESIGDIATGGDGWVTKGSVSNSPESVKNNVSTSRELEEKAFNSAKEHYQQNQDQYVENAKQEYAAIQEDKEDRVEDAREDVEDALEDSGKEQKVA